MADNIAMVLLQSRHKTMSVFDTTGIGASHPRTATNVRDIGVARILNRSSRHIRLHYGYGATRRGASANMSPKAPTLRYVSLLSGSQLQSYDFFFQMKLLFIRNSEMFYPTSRNICFSVASGRIFRNCSTSFSKEASGGQSFLQKSFPQRASGVFRRDQPQPYSLPRLSTGYTKSSVTI